MSETPKFRSPEAERIAREAKHLATDEGHDWNAMTPEQRKQFKQRVREAERRNR